LTQVFETSEEVEFDDSSKIVFFSDCHRGDGSWADNFAPNKIIFCSALNYYYKKGFIYIEIGDGDELWENRRFSDILQEHSDVFEIMGKYHDEGRLLMIYGNHDIVKKNRSILEPVFKNIKVHEGLILKHVPSGSKVFVVHGHQGDLINDRLWPIARFVVRYIVKPFELIGFRNPLSPAYNTRRKEIVEDRIIKWVKSKKQMIITGHTHRPVFPGAEDPPYFNDGSCVRRGSITCIEIDSGQISLVRWFTKTNTSGAVCIYKETVGGPKELARFLDDV